MFSLTRSAVQPMHKGRSPLAAPIPQLKLFDTMLPTMLALLAEYLACCRTAGRGKSAGIEGMYLLG